MGDPNMATALQWAREIGPAPALPDSLREVVRRAQLVNAIDRPLIWNPEGLLLFQFAPDEKMRRLDEVAKICETYAPDTNNDTERTNLALRLWSGCLAAAKTIAHETRSGQNTPEMRKALFAEIDSIAATDPIFRAGVEGAPAFKSIRNQSYSLEGVPEGSSVRKHV